MDISKKTVHLLALEKTRDNVERWVKLFRNAGYPSRVEHISNVESMESALLEHTWDIFLCIEEAPLLNASQVLATIKRMKLDIPVIITLPEYSAHKTSLWLKNGARDAIPETNEEHVLFAIIRELTALEYRRVLKQTQNKLDASENRCQQLLTSASGPIAYIHEGMHIDANDAYIELLGYEDSDSLAGMPLIDMASPDYQLQIKKLLKQCQQGEKTPAIECHLAHSDGHFIPASIKLSEAEYDGELCAQLAIQPIAVPVVNDIISDSASNAGRMTPRESFFAKGDDIISSAKNTALVWLQLDDYDQLRNEVNISSILSVQHSINDMLQNSFPENHTCHYADDVYLMLLTDIATSDLKNKLSQLLLSIDETLFGTQSESLTISATLGFAEKQKNENLKELMDHAMIAYQCKLSKDSSRIYQYSVDDIQKDKARDGDVEAMIQQALTNNNLRLLFQPIVNISGSSEQHYEVFLRLLSPQGDTVPAARFIDAAEASGQMAHLDRWVLRQCVQQLATAKRRGETIRLMMHIDSASIKGIEFIKFLTAVLKATKLNGEAITLQMTEESVHRNLKEVITFTKKIQKLGCNLAITRFTGDDRAMKLLNHLNVSSVRIEGHFTELLEKGKADELEKILLQLRSQQVACIVPKVESSQTLSQLWQLGAEYIQGYYIQEPMETMNYEFT